MSENQSEQELMKKLENATPEEAKQLVVQSIIPPCRGLAKSFFDCIEDQLKTYESKEMDLKQMEKEFNSTISPFCMNEYNLENCLKQNGPGH